MFKPGDCLRLTKAVEGHDAGDACIVLETKPYAADPEKTSMLVFFIRTGTEEDGWNARWYGWEKVDA